jgi:hypothetical protein
MNLPASEELEIVSSVVFERVDGELVLLELETGSYYGLNEVGALIFQALEQKAELAQVIDELALRYEVPPDRIEADCANLIDGLLQAGLVRRRAAEEHVDSKV